MAPIGGDVTCEQVGEPQPFDEVIEERQRPDAFGTQTEAGASSADLCRL